MDLNDEAKQIVQQLGDAINRAVERSSEVSDAIERLRRAGYEMELALRLEIGLRAHTAVEEEGDSAAGAGRRSLDLTDEDRRTLRSMKIRFDDLE